MEYKNILSQHGIKNTFLRTKMLEYILSTKNPFNADDVMDSLLDLGINKTTVYRNIDLFQKKGILREIDMRKDSAFYELNSNDHHHHIICRDCGYMETFSLCEAEHMIQQVLRDSRRFSSIYDHSFEMFGVCNRCA